MALKHVPPTKFSLVESWPVLICFPTLVRKVTGVKGLMIIIMVHIYTGMSNLATLV